MSTFDSMYPRRGLQKTSYPVTKAKSRLEVKIGEMAHIPNRDNCKEFAVKSLRLTEGSKLPAAKVMWVSN